MKPERMRRIVLRTTLGLRFGKLDSKLVELVKNGGSEQDVINYIHQDDDYNEEQKEMFIKKFKKELKKETMNGFLK